MEMSHKQFSQKGGEARMRKLSKDERKALALKAVTARWEAARKRYRTTTRGTK